MTARVLVVDDIAVNVKLLEARLSAEYFEVVTANSGKQALDICAQGDVDIVLLDVMMPEMDGFEVCRRLKADPKTHNIPVVMVTALDEVKDRVAGLTAGADDFLNKPVDDVQLIARVKSLVRLKALSDELQARVRTGHELTIQRTDRSIDTIDADNGQILLIDSDARHAARVKSFLSDWHQVDILTTPSDAVGLSSEKNYELILINMQMSDSDPLRVCSQLRTFEPTRMVPLILIAEESDRAKVIRGLELGVNDFIMRPIERNELAARVKTQIKRLRYGMELRQSLQETLQLAVVDELTGLYNRRYLDRHLSILLSKAQEQGRDMAVILLDLDHFKSVNDTYGHDAGDAILKEFAARLRRNIRGVDLACRYGGEEFVVLMPDIDFCHAQNAADRARVATAEHPFVVNGVSELPLTVSIGLAMNSDANDTPETLLKRADIALYQAKRSGRNRVCVTAA